MCGATTLQTLRRQGEIKELFRRGKRYRGRLMDVIVLRRPDAPTRALFVTGRKVGSAVMRNRVRRRMREALRSVINSFQGTCDVAMIAFPTASAASYAQLRQELQSRLQKSGLLPPEEGE